MEKYEVMWSNQIKFVNSRNSRISLILFQKESFEKAKRLCQVESPSGIYIIELLQNNGASKKFYIGESQDVWKRVKRHITSERFLKNNILEKTFGDIFVIFSNNKFKDFTKNEMQWFEKSLINDFQKNFEIENENSGYNAKINPFDEELLISELENVKRALNFTNKNYYLVKKPKAIQFSSKNKIPKNEIYSKNRENVKQMAQENAKLFEKYNKSTPDVQSAYQSIIAIIKKWSKFEMKYKQVICYARAPNRFIELYFLKSKLCIQMQLKSHQKSEILQIQDISKIGQWGILGKRIRIEDSKNLQEVIRLVKLSYWNVGNKDSILSNKEKWIKVVPIIRLKSDVKWNGSFEFNALEKKIKASIGTTFSGIAKGSLVNWKIIRKTFKKWKKDGYLEGELDKSTRHYTIKVTKELWLSISAMAIFTRAGVNNGWIYWKDENGNLIDEYR